MPAWEQAANPARPRDYVVGSQHLCLLWNPVASIRWAADALWLLRSAAVDWSRLVAQAQAFALTLPVLDRLSYLRTLLDAAVLDAVLEQLQATPVSGLERRAYISWANPPNWRYVLPQLETQYRQYSAAGRGRGLAGQVGGRLRFLRDLLGMDHGWQVPGRVVLKVCEWWQTGRLFLK